MLCANFQVDLQKISRIRAKMFNNNQCLRVTLNTKELLF